MKYLLSLLFCLTTGAFAFSQQAVYLNRSICPPPGMSALDETNAYVQGAGHNYYLSYPPEAHVGSYSEYIFPYGTEQNPMVVYVDSTEEGEEQKYYLVEPLDDLVAGLDPTEPFVDSGVWTDTYPERNVPVETEGYSIIDSYVFQCIAQEDEEL